MTDRTIIKQNEQNLQINLSLNEWRKRLSG